MWGYVQYQPNKYSESKVFPCWETGMYEVRSPAKTTILEGYPELVHHVVSYICFSGSNRSSVHLQNPSRAKQLTYI